MNLEDLSRKYDINLRNLKFLQRKYGSIEAFYKIYIEALINGNIKEIKVPEVIEKKLIKYFDLSEPDAIGTNYRYVKLMNDILGINYGFIVKDSIKSVLDEVINSALIGRERIIIRRHYGLDGKCETLEVLANQYGVTRERIRQINNNALKKMRASKYINILRNAIYDAESTKEVISRFFEEEDIFYNENNHSNSKMKNRLVYIILDNKIKRLCISESTSYIKDAIDLEKEIKDSMLDESQKTYLLNLLQNKKASIAKNQRPELIALFEKKIESRKMKDVLNTEVEDLFFSTRTISCLDNEEINTVRQIISKTKGELLYIRNMGMKSKQEILEKLQFLGFNIPTEDNVKIQDSNDIDFEIIDMEDSSFFSMLEDEIKSSGLDEDGINYLLSKIHENKTRISDEHQKLLLDFFERSFLPREIIPDIYMPIEDLDFSVRTFNALKNIGIDTVEKIIEKSKSDLMVIRNLGKKSINEIIEKIVALGFEIPEDEKQPIKKGNKTKLTIYCKKDIEKIAKEIESTDLNEQDKSYLLGILLERAIHSLQSAYDILEKQLSIHYRLRNEAIQYAEIAECRPDTEEIDNKIETLKNEQLSIKREMEDISSLE